MLTSNNPREFDTPTKAVLYFSGDTYEINGVSVVVRLSDGTLHITRHDGGFCEIPPGYLFYEFCPMEIDL